MCNNEVMYQGLSGRSGLLVTASTCVVASTRASLVLATSACVYLVVPAYDLTSTLPLQGLLAQQELGPRMTMEQEYREALINLRLAEAWEAGGRWARCDLGGLPADASRRTMADKAAA